MEKSGSWRTWRKVRLTFVGPVIAQKEHKHCAEGTDGQSIAQSHKPKDRPSHTNNCHAQRKHKETEIGLDGAQGRPQVRSDKGNPVPHEKCIAATGNSSNQTKHPHEEISRHEPNESHKDGGHNAKEEGHLYQHLGILHHKGQRCAGKTNRKNTTDSHDEEDTAQGGTLTDGNSIARRHDKETYCDDHSQLCEKG